MLKVSSGTSTMPCSRGCRHSLIRFGGAETSITAAMPPGRMWVAHYTPQPQCMSSFRYFMLHFNFFIQFIFSNKQISEVCTYKFAPSLGKPAVSCSCSRFCCTFLSIRTDVKTMKDATPGWNTCLENNTGFVKGYRENRPSLTFWNTLVLPAVIPDTETCWVLGLLVTYLLYHEMSENGIEPNIRKRALK